MSLVNLHAPSGANVFSVLEMLTQELISARSMGYAHGTTSYQVPHHQFGSQQQPDMGIGPLDPKEGVYRGNRYGNYGYQRRPLDIATENTVIAGALMLRNLPVEKLVKVSVCIGLLQLRLISIANVIEPSSYSDSDIIQFFRALFEYNDEAVADAVADKRYAVLVDKDFYDGVTLTELLMCLIPRAVDITVYNTAKPFFDEINRAFGTTMFN